MGQAQVVVEARLESASSVEGRGTDQMVRPLHYLHSHTDKHGFV